MISEEKKYKVEIIKSVLCGIRINKRRLVKIMNKEIRNNIIVDRALVDKALEIVRREWENVRYSFEMCGDIGNFNIENFRASKWFFEEGFEWLISNVIEMDKKIPQLGYATPEASNVFTILASRAAEKLGFNHELASAFGIGYGFVRTGLLSGNRLEPTQAIFCKLFFPLGMGSEFEWGFDSSLVKTKIKTVFDGFKNWQDNPQIYLQDLTQLQDTGKVWKEWEQINE